MIKIEIKNRFTGSILFECSKENNTIKAVVLNKLSSSMHYELIKNQIKIENYDESNDSKGIDRGI